MQYFDGSRELLAETRHEKIMLTQLGLHHVQNIKLTLKLLLYTNLYHLQLHIKTCVQVSSIMSVYQRPIKCNMYF